jgi:hypothetical protein
LISSVESKKAATSESKILASIRELMETAVKDLSTSDHIYERYLMLDSVSLK